jgi:hypothetical protein
MPFLNPLAPSDVGQVAGGGSESVEESLAAVKAQLALIQAGLQAPGAITFAVQSPSLEAEGSVKLVRGMDYRQTHGLAARLRAVSPLALSLLPHIESLELIIGDRPPVSVSATANPIAGGFEAVAELSRAQTLALSPNNLAMGGQTPWFLWATLDDGDRVQVGDGLVKVQEGGVTA